VIGAGDLTVGSISVGDDDLVIAVDGGLNYCTVLEIEPDLILGDFDSVGEEQKEALLELRKQIPDCHFRGFSVKVLRAVFSKRQITYIADFHTVNITHVDDSAKPVSRNILFAQCQWKNHTNTVSQLNIGFRLIVHKRE
jgi:hypothetical protein